MDLLKKFFRSFRRKLELEDIKVDEGLSMKEVMIKIIPLLGSDKEILAVLKKMDYDQELCRMACPHMLMIMKDEKRVMEVLKATNYNNSVLSVFFRYLKVEEKTEEQRYKLIEESKFNVEFCRWMLPSLSSSEKIMYVLKICKYDIHLSITTVKILSRDNREDALKILENTGYHQSVCLAVLENFK